MLRLKVIGCGAAGNKAAISLIDDFFDSKDVLLINSTAKDIPQEHKDISLIFGSAADSLGGCGKEREIAKRLFLKDLKSGTISLDSLVDPTTNAVIICSSTEGGSGSGITPIVAQYIREVIGVPVIVVLFFGFNSDVRGMQNSIEICQELAEDYGVIGIANSKFMEEANSNKIKAEELANKEFCKIIRILSGVDIIPGSQNIDDTDLYKLVATPGYMHVESASMKNVKNVEMFNKTINAAIDTSRQIDTKKSVERIGCIFDIPKSIEDFMDYEASVLIQRYGKPYEMYTHVQNTEGTSGTCTWIASGMDLPIDEVKEIFENYKKSSASVSKSKDSFFGEISGLTGNQEDSMFNMLSSGKRNNMSKSAFFDSYGFKDKDKKDTK